MASESRIYETSDLGTAAFVSMSGLEILGATRGGPREGGRFIFRFADPEGRGANYQVEYVNSDCRHFDDAVRSLKKLCYDSKPRQGVKR